MIKYIPWLQGIGRLCVGLLAQWSLHANDLGVHFSSDGAVVTAEHAAFQAFSGASSAIYSVGDQRQRMGTKDSQFIGEVICSTVTTPFGEADLMQATYGRPGVPYQYTLKIKALKHLNAFTVQAILHNRSDADVRLHSFDLYDMRAHMGGHLAVAEASEWLVTPLMQDLEAVTFDLAKKRLNEAALFYRPNGDGFLVGPVGPAEAYTHVQFVGESLIASVAMDNVLVRAGESRRSEEMIFAFEPSTTSTQLWTGWVAATHGARLHRGPVYGWCSWYDRTTQIDAAHVLDVTRTIQENLNTFGKGVIQLTTVTRKWTVTGAPMTTSDGYGECCCEHP